MQSLRNPMSDEISIALYVPNIIDYVRASLLGMSFFCRGVCFVFFVVFSMVLDAADGYCARRLGQTSTFGAILDIYLDRMTTATVLIKTAQKSARSAAFVLYAYLVLDATSHFFQVSCALLMNTSHKNLPGKIVSFYHQKYVLFSVAVLEFSALVLFYLYGNSRTVALLLVSAILIKGFFSTAGLATSAALILALDAKSRTDAASRKS